PTGHDSAPGCPGGAALPRQADVTALRRNHLEIHRRDELAITAGRHFRLRGIPRETQEVSKQYFELLVPVAQSWERGTKDVARHLLCVRRTLCPAVHAPRSHPSVRRLGAGPGVRARSPSLRGG